MIQKYQTALGIQEPERSYTTGNSPPLVSALLAARPQRGVRPFSYVCTDTNQFLVPPLIFSSSAQRGPHAAECDLLKSLAPGLSSLSNGGRFGNDATGRGSIPEQGLEEKKAIVLSLIKDSPKNKSNDRVTIAFRRKYFVLSSNVSQNEYLRGQADVAHLDPLAVVALRSFGFVLR